MFLDDVEFSYVNSILSGNRTGSKHPSRACPDRKEDRAMRKTLIWLLLSMVGGAAVSCIPPVADLIAPQRESLFWGFIIFGCMLYAAVPALRAGKREVSRALEARWVSKERADRLLASYDKIESCLRIVAAAFVFIISAAGALIATG